MLFASYIFIQKRSWDDVIVEYSYAYVIISDSLKKNLLFSVFAD